MFGTELGDVTALCWNSKWSATRHKALKQSEKFSPQVLKIHQETMAQLYFTGR